MANSALITGSQGYMGVFTDVAYARSGAYNGDYGRFVVQNATTWSVVSDSTLARGVIVRAGRMVGDGIYDETTADIAVQFDLPPGGTTVYGAVVITRDWTAKTSTVRAVLGTTNTAQAPAGLSSNAGGVSDQVVALVQIVAGQALVGPILDRRTWAEGSRVVSALRSTDIILASGNLTQSVVGFTGQLARRGEYVIAATATLAGFPATPNTDCALTFAATGGFDLQGQPITLSGSWQSLLHMSKPYLHPGGLMDANCNLFTSGAWQGGVVRGGAFISATYIGPFTPQ
mgnify:CR=1 FL=1